MSISEQLRKEIAAYEFSRNALCAKTGLDPASLSRFMAGERGLNTSSVDALCKELGLMLKPIMMKSRRNRAGDKE